MCLLFILRWSADRRFASWRCAPFGGVVCAGYLANLDCCFGLVLRLVFTGGRGGLILVQVGQLREVHGDLSCLVSGEEFRR